MNAEETPSTGRVSGRPPDAKCGIYCIIPFCSTLAGVLMAIPWGMVLNWGFFGYVAAGVIGGIAGFMLGFLFLWIVTLPLYISIKNRALSLLFEVGILVLALGVIIVPLALDFTKMNARIRAERAMRQGKVEVTGTVPGDPWEKITFDLGALDDDGLRGPVDGKVAVSYEFCIPDTNKARAEVAAIDSTVEFMAGSPGRIGCGTDECLCIGSTHQKGFREILEELAELPYVDRIDEAYFE